ncbi:MAG: hypothetical protein P4L74_06565 [Candidatus Doudnabacteria bacterium]|nr:hypothetical protein [Candidatus Doudnabacteria bacterium]
MQPTQPYLVGIELKCLHCKQAPRIKRIYVSSEFQLGVETWCDRCNQQRDFEIPLETLGTYARDAKDKQTQEQFALTIKGDDKRFLTRLKIKTE